ncbi:MAG: hypothetical protein ACYC6Y_04380 [Thermoguttaceae bacterium]
MHRDLLEPLSSRRKTRTRITKYWTIPDRQVEISVVLADPTRPQTGDS